MNEHDLQLAEQVNGMEIGKALHHLATYFPEKVTFSTSFGLEDQVVTDFIAREKANISIFTLDTGRLFSETYTVWESTKTQYEIRIQAYYPNAAAIETYVNEKGPNAFYLSVDNRKECCGIRKVEPLKRALAGNKIWITGLRSEQSSARKDLNMIEWDEANQIIKYNPLLHWTEGDVREHIKKYQVPYNVLHDRGFLSIGCAPCTRAVRPGEDARAGRWWWEDNSKKECGLHAK